jgi:hypothetical protein
MKVERREVYQSIRENYKYLIIAVSLYRLFYFWFPETQQLIRVRYLFLK